MIIFVKYMLENPVGRATRTKICVKVIKMIISKELTVISNSRNKKKYEALGYNVPEKGKEFNIKVEDATVGCRSIITLKCDYCGKIYSVKYNSYAKSSKVVNKDACKSCCEIKQRDVIKAKYGVENISMLKETQEKIKTNNLLKYGVESTSQLESVKQKTKINNIKKYGVEYPMQTKEFQERLEKTSLEKYGTKRPTQNKEIKNKVKNTLLERYGVTNPILCPGVLENVLISKYNSNSQTSSKQQNKLHEIIGGELNYPFKRYYIDIAFVEQKIAVEYNGGGHNLSVKLGNLTQEEFDRNERFRDKQLFEDGWRIIKFISIKNKILQDKDILDIFNYSLSLIDNGYHKIEIDMDKNVLKYRDKEIDLTQIALND